MAVEAIVAWARAARGYAGLAVYDGCAELFSEGVDAGRVAALTGALRAAPGAWRASAAITGMTYIAFRAGGLVVVLKVAGLFPPLAVPPLEEPEFAGAQDGPALPPRAAARREAEAALRQFGLL